MQKMEKNLKSNRLDVEKILEDFDKEEKSKSHRKGTFKIDKPFEEALDTILKAKPELKAKEKGKIAHVGRGSADKTLD